MTFSALLTPSAPARVAPSHSHGKPALRSFLQLESSLFLKRTLSPAPAQRGRPERRTSARLKGRQVRVSVKNAQTGQKLFEGWVLDRSQGGLGLSVPEQVAPGTILTLRSTSLAGSHAVEVEARNSRADGDRWVLGCRFLRSPRWEVMLQFC
jgi:hypothetical protein